MTGITRTVAGEAAMIQELRNEIAALRGEVAALRDDRVFDFSISDTVICSQPLPLPDVIQVPTVFGSVPLTETDARRIDLKIRLDELNTMIGEYPHWGAALTEMDEERREIRAKLAALDAEQPAHVTDRDSVQGAFAGSVGVM